MHLNREIIALIDADENVTLEEVAAEVDAAKDVEVEKNADVQGRLEESQAQLYHIDLEHAAKVLSIQDDELKPAELKEVIKVVTTAKLMTEVVTAATTTITATPITAATITATPSATRKRKGVVIRDPEETATPSTIVHSEPKSKDKGKGILVEESKPLKKQAQIEHDEVKKKEKEDNDVLRYQALKRKLQTEAHAMKNMMVYLKNMAGFKMDFFKGMSYDDIRPIFEKYFNSNVAFLEKNEKELEEEASRALKRKSESSKEKAVKKQKYDEEVEELKKHLQIVPNENDDFYTKATPLALKFLVPNNFSDDFLLATLKAMFEKPDVEAQVWKNQRSIHGLAKVKSWRLLESCGVHIITFTTTQMILLVKRRYPLIRFTLDQMLNNVRLEVKEENFKKYTLKDYYCWLKTYCCWYKLKLLDNAVDSRLRLSEESVAADEKMKK
nr:hypothetical protein [Tanacetum cinerariifolium]